MSAASNMTQAGTVWSLMPSRAKTIQEASGSTAQLSVPLRVVQIGMLIGLLWKFAFFRAADQVYASIPIHDGFFPVGLQQAATLRVAFLTFVVSIAIAWLTTHRATRITATAICGLAATVMLLHQGSYNDMTFTTVWWCNVWALWYVWRMDVDPPDALRRKAAFLSRLMLSVVLLGGAMGKWTPEYWSGEVFFEIYFRDRDFWVFNILRSWLDTESLQWMAMAYSRKVILIETVAGLGLWLLPARWAAVTAAVIFASIALLSNFLLFSVLTPLIGLSLAGWYRCPPSDRHA
jgi:hypothetical protein